MTTFVLKKYEEKKPEENKTSSSAPSADSEKKEEAVLEIKATDSIAEIVAQALYKAMPQNVVIEQKPDGSSDNSVISAEDINTNPGGTIRNVKNGSCLLIIAEMFKTQKEEWFLSTLVNKNVRAFYSVESFMTHIKKELGV
ncbi:hypothetical protein [Flavobacterium sp.]|jgi:hypothetical protein|uniref:hypothetical protein n=1 Tax=Flavobacterium sp. TaxID=239 RepID=UPI0037BEDA0F